MRTCGPTPCILTFAINMIKLNPDYFENQIPLEPALGAGGWGWGRAASQTAIVYEKYSIKSSLRFFCDFMCSLFPKAIL